MPSTALRRLRRLRQLTATEARLLARASVGLAAWRAGLAVLPFRRLARLALRRPILHRPGPRPSSDQVAWSVSTAASVLPGRYSCLPQALATIAILRSHRIEAELRLGALRDDRGAIEAHAWVESQGRVVIGSTAQHFERFSDIEPAL